MTGPFSCMVDLNKFREVNGAACEQIGIARIVDPKLTQHLADNNFNVLVVNVNAVVFVYFQNFSDYIFLYTPGTLYLHDVMRINRAVCDQFSCFNVITVIN